MKDKEGEIILVHPCMKKWLKRMGFSHFFVSGTFWM